MAPSSEAADRVVLVTGEGGLAADVAHSLLGHGARVALAGPCADGARLAVPPGAALLALGCGRDDLVGLGRAVDTVVERLGRLDHVVNLIAARPRPGPLMELDPLSLRDVLYGDLMAPLACVQRAYRRWMAAHGGSVVNVVAATPHGGPQDAALAGLTELTEWLAAELAPRVDVHTLLPSPSLDAGAYRAGVAQVVCDLLTRRTNPAHGPVLVLSETPACPSHAA